MKNDRIAIVVMLSLSLSSYEVEARKGLGTLFKFGQGAKAVNGVKDYEFNTLSVDELRRCLLLEQRIDTSEGMLSLKQPTISAKASDLKKIEAEIILLKRYLDLNQNTVFHTQQQLDHFNQKIEHYNKLIAIFNDELKAYNSLEKTYNSSVNSHNAIVNGFQLSCADKRYYEDDLVVVKSDTSKSTIIGAHDYKINHVSQNQKNIFIWQQTINDMYL